MNFLTPRMIEKQENETGPKTKSYDIDAKKDTENRREKHHPGTYRSNQNDFLPISFFM